VRIEDKMPKLILVKHSQPQIDPLMPAREWHLSQEGRLRCRPLADKLAAYEPGVIVASTEPKATETAQIVAERLDKPFEVAGGLHEHNRSNVAFYSPQVFDAAVATFFQKPGELVFGRETALQAQERFSKAVEDVLEKHIDENVVIVAHGTVITLFVAAHAAIEPFAFWKRLGLPSFVVISLPGLELVGVDTLQAN
jgi:broad specificity phosphatase PhoE